jgi:hypothetical protein
MNTTRKGWTDATRERLGVEQTDDGRFVFRLRDAKGKSCGAGALPPRRQ